MKMSKLTGKGTAVQTAQPKPTMAGKTATTTAEFYGVRQVPDGVVFTVYYPNAKSVCIAGDFNNWQPDRNPMYRVSESGVWELKMPLKRGVYKYRLVVDGKWQHDPYNDRTEPNPYGELNSVVKKD